MRTWQLAAQLQQVKHECVKTAPSEQWHENVSVSALNSSVRVCQMLGTAGVIQGSAPRQFHNSHSLEGLRQVMCGVLSSQARLPASSRVMCWEPSPGPRPHMATISPGPTSPSSVPCHAVGRMSVKYRYLRKGR